ncbi:MAG: hypothetical protein ACE5FL_03050 [Myxococcota bacterium]
MQRDHGRVATPDELVFALCHEVGNLLAAARLEASLLDASRDDPALATASERISEISARAGSLLALVRPLLDASSVQTLPTDPVEMLRGLRRGLDASLDARVAIDLDSAADLPDVAVAAEVLHHLLLNAIFFGLAAADGPGEARVRARADGERVAFEVEDHGRPERDEDAGVLCGRPLAHAIARTLLAGQGGAFGCSRSGGRTCVVFALPAADA